MGGLRQRPLGPQQVRHTVGGEQRSGESSSVTSEHAIWRPALGDQLFSRRSRRSSIASIATPPAHCDPQAATALPVPSTAHRSLSAAVASLQQMSSTGALRRALQGLCRASLQQQHSWWPPQAAAGQHQLSAQAMQQCAGSSSGFSSLASLQLRVSSNSSLCIHHHRQQQHVQCSSQQRSFADASGAGGPARVGRQRRRPTPHQHQQQQQQQASSGGGGGGRWQQQQQPRELSELQLGRQAVLCVPTEKLREPHFIGSTDPWRDRSRAAMEPRQVRVMAGTGSWADTSPCGACCLSGHTAAVTIVTLAPWPPPAPHRPSSHRPFTTPHTPHTAPHTAQVDGSYGDDIEDVLLMRQQLENSALPNEFKRSRLISPAWDDVLLQVNRTVKVCVCVCVERGQGKAGAWMGWLVAPHVPTAPRSHTHALQSVKPPSPSTLTGDQGWQGGDAARARGCRQQ
jgi:hypothetical protein